MVKKSFLLLMGLLICSIFIGVTVAVAQTEDALWEFEIINSEAIITGYTGSGTDIFIPGTVEKDGVEYPVIKLGDELFKDNEEISSVTLGEGIKEIGENTFSGATSLVCILTNNELETIGDNAFCGCTSFNSIILGEKVKSVGENTFYGCSPDFIIYCNSGSYAESYAESAGFNYVIIGSVETPVTYTENGISYYLNDGEAVAFKYEGNEEEITVPSSVKGYPVTSVRTAFQENDDLKTINLPNSIKHIENGAFSGCWLLTNVKLPDGLETIGNSAFAHCQNLSSLKLPEGLKSIGNFAFQQSENLYDIVLPESLESLGVYAFLDVICLEKINIPSKITAIPKGAFANTGMREIIMHDKVTTIGEAAFRSSELMEYTIPDSITTIESFAFQDCTWLKSIYIPDSVTDMGATVFSGCTELESVRISENLEYISSSVFMNCTSLKSITLPSKLKVIWNDSFSGCTALKTVNIPESVTHIDSGAFEKCLNINKVTLPAGLTKMYSDSFHPATILMVYNGSYAHTFAENNNLLFYIKSGDSEPEVYTYDSIRYMITDSQAVAVICLKKQANVVIPETVEGYPVTDIRKVFYNNKTLKTIKLPSTIKNLGSNAFDKCTSLTTVELSEGLESIGGRAFAECLKLTQINIPSTVTTMGANVFLGCKTLTTIAIPEGALTKLPANAFYQCKALSSVTLPKTLKIIDKYAFGECISLQNIEIPYGVEQINANAFEKCTALKTVVIADSVTVMGSKVFSGCTLLEEVILSKSLTNIPSSVFDGCVNLKSFVIGENVTVISGGAFNGCKALSNLTIPEGVTTLYLNAFNNCENLVYVTLPKSITSLNASSFTGTVAFLVYEGTYAHTFAEENGLLYFVISQTNIPELCTKDGLTYIISDGYATLLCADDTLTDAVIPSSINGSEIKLAECVFKGNTSLRSVSMPDYITEIPTSTFEGCTALERVTFGENVTRVGENAFKNCSKLSEISPIPNVTEIGDYAFYKCSLIDLKLPEKLEKLGKYAFGYCFALSNINLNNKLTYVPENAFEYCYGLTNIVIPENIVTLQKGAFYYCMGIVSAELSPKLETIGELAFSRCKKLEKIIIPDSVTTIERRAFEACEALTEVKIPDGVTTINYQTFYNCYNLESIHIPGSVKQIMELSFANCKKLKNAIIEEGVTKIANNAFGSSGLQTLKIPESVVTFGTGILPSTTIWVVYEDSAALTFAKSKNYLHFVIKKTGNPEIAYGTGLAGRVTYSDLTPVANETVEILYSDGTVKESVQTDANGEYTFTYAEVGKYTLRVIDKDNNRADESVSVKRMNVFEVFVTGNTNLVLKSNSWDVSGKVTASGEVTVALYDVSGNLMNEILTQDGEFTFSNVSNGNYVIKAKDSVSSEVKEITVFNNDITDLIFELGNVSAGISGKAVIEAGNNETYPCKWADISLYNSDGILIDTKKSNADGSFVFDNLNLGEYFIIGQTSEIRFDSDHGYDRPYNLTGNAYVFVEHPDTYEIGTIILHESTQSRTNISGKVTAHGEPQNCNVVLTDASGREIDSQRVGNNGKYTFKKLNDGLYFITATTDSNGSGFCVITIINGKAYGTLNITVHKEQRFADREEKWKSDIGDCTNKEKALLIKGRIREEKEFYDSLSHKEKKQFSKEYTETLNKLVEWTADVGYIVNDENVEVENGGFAVSGEEIENETKVDFVLDIQKSDAYQKSETGIKNSDDYIQHSIEEMAGDRNLIQYYDITLTKKADGKEYRIESIAKNTDTTGKVRITVTIPEEYKGYDKYSFIHVHKGEVTELTDLDDNPDTVTFEVDKFSTFVLSGSNEEVVSPSGKITYENGEITVTADKDSILYIKTLNSDGTSYVTTIKNITAGSSEKLAFTEYDSAFLWDENMQPLCHKFTISQ